MVIEAEGFDLAAGTKPLLDDAELVLERGEHVALIGPNGSGKSTLLEAIVGRRASAGSVTASSSPTSRSTRSSSTSAAACSSARWAPPACSGRRRRRSSAASSSPAGTTHEKRVDQLSGGERRRLALALVVASGANFLVLDEPTNHLDLESRESLEAALEAFPGTVLLVSHDRACSTPSPSGSSPSRTARLRSYPGGWADYVRIRADEDAPAPPKPKERKEKPKPEKPKPRDAASSSCIETSIQERELELAELERRLAEDWGDAEIARCAQGRARGAAGPARTLGAAVRVRAAGVTILVRRRRHGVQAMTLSARTANPPRRSVGFAATAEEHLDDVYAYLVYLTRDRSLAEDLAADTFEKALRSWRRFDPRRASARTWLCQIARTTALDWFRAEERRQRREERAAAPEHVDAPSPRVSHPHLEAALAELSAGEREVIALRVLLELDGDEAARVLGISPTAVSTRLSRALKKLEEKVSMHV